MKISGFNRLVRDMVFASKRDKRVVLLPLCFLLLVLAGVLVFLTISGPLAPFIYPLF